jgi:hypothetical protein
MDTDERELLTASLRKVVESSGGDLLGALDDFGWSDVLADDDEAAVAILFDLQGEHLTPTSALEGVLLASLGTGAGTAADRVVLPPGPVPAAEIRSGAGEADTVTVDGLMVATAAPPGIVTFPATVDGEFVVATTSWPANAVWPPAPVGIDPTAGWGHVRFTVPRASVATHDSAEARSGWEQAVAAGQRATAHELVAIGRTMLGLAVEHVSERRQFGVPIGSFQAVQHRLADVCLWQHCAEEALGEAWQERDGRSAALAKTLAGRFVTASAKHCQQVLGGMGFTWEHDFHRYLRRSLLLEPVLGSAGELRRQLGRAVIETGGTLPRLAAL